MSKSKDLCSLLSKSEYYGHLKKTEESQNKLKSIIDDYILDSLSKLIPVEINPKLTTVEKVKMYTSYASGNEAKRFLNAIDRHVKKNLPALYSTYHILDYIR